MDTSSPDFVRAGTVSELKARGRLVLHGPHRPVLVVHDKDRIYALDNRCPHMVSTAEEYWSAWRSEIGAAGVRPLELGDRY
jgi:nitrite reductase/ring-hydroxylating ferredoxin subunit